MSRSRKNPRLPSDAFPAHVEALAHDGRGVARVAGKAVFIDGALPGEDVSFNYTALHSQYDEGRIAAISQPSPERVEPRCMHFGVCGGCSLQHLDTAKQLSLKQDWLLESLARIGKVRPEQLLDPLTGPAWGYRRKARLGVKYVYKKGKVLVGFRERASPYLADLCRCEVLHPRVGGLLEELARLVEGLSISQRVPQIEVAIGDTAVALSFRVLDPPSDEDKSRLIAFSRCHDLQIYLQPKGPETTARLWPEAAELSYRLPNYDLELAFRPYHFTQVNAEINQQLVDRAIALLDVQKDDRVLDLFCGLGNFTLALARRARWVTGVEGDSSLVAWAERNAERNGIANASFFSADLTGDVWERSWMQGSYNKILLDPPRSGALAMMAPIATLRAQRIVYVSCHPATLARDAGELVHRFGYRLLSAGVMDMFPHTAHVESIALFESVA